MSEPVSVSYVAYVTGTRIPFRYAVLLYVDDMPTGVTAYAWGRRRADEAMHYMVNNGNALINQYGVAAELAAQIYARKREEAMARVQAGDRIKLLVDIGQFKKGRVCRVVTTPEPSFYEARGGAPEWDDEQYVLVMPVHSPMDRIALGPGDLIPLKRGEFGPLDMEIDE